jgi:hypothetical protein
MYPTPSTSLTGMRRACAPSPKRHGLVVLALVAALLGLTAQSARADDWRGHGGRGWAHGRGGPQVVFDTRYHHDRFYPSAGYVVGGLPLGSISVGFNRGHYYFSSGVWFQPYGPRYVVVNPPMGVAVPVLPPQYSTVWVGGVPYYYANGVYYTSVPNQGYVVSSPPPAEVAVQVPAPAPATLPEPILYPRNQQGAMQTQADRQACNRWASEQPGATEPSVYQRAQAACLDGRGYTVR